LFFLFSLFIFGVRPPDRVVVVVVLNRTDTYFSPVYPSGASDKLFEKERQRRPEPIFGYKSHEFQKRLRALLGAWAFRLDACILAAFTRGWSLALSSKAS
jgi:hypothetical protein